MPSTGSDARNWPERRACLYESEHVQIQMPGGLVLSMNHTPHLLCCFTVEGGVAASVAYLGRDMFDHDHLCVNLEDFVYTFLVK